MRQTWYGSELVQSNVLQQQERDTAKSLAQFVLDAYGANTSFFTGLNASAALSGLTVNIAPGALYQYGPIDPTTWSVLGADTWEGTLLGLLLNSTTITGFTAPAVTGQSINYLLEAQIQVTDTAPVNMPFSTGAISGAPQTAYQMRSPSRQNLVVFQLKAGTAATTGSQVTPTADSGWVPLWQIQVNSGQGTIPSNQVTKATGAPQFYGFVQMNPSGTSVPVVLSPTAPQTGFINISSGITAGTPAQPGYFTDFGNGGWLRFGNPSSTPGASGVTEISSTNSLTVGGYLGNLVAFFDRNSNPTVYQPLVTVDISGNAGFNGSVWATNNLNYGGTITYSGSHAGTDVDPFPLAPINATQLGGKVVGDFALASGHYIVAFGGAPTLTTGNAGVTGYFQANQFQSLATTGTAPFTVSSTTKVVNLNADLLDGFTSGNSTGQIPIANGSLCQNLNAQFLNGLPSSAFALAGSYAAMNTNNAGTFTATSWLSSTGGTGSSQVYLGYTATNALGINNGGPIAYVQSASAPLTLIGTVQTTGALTVGSSSSLKNVTAQDVFSNGLVRSGIPCWRVTRNAQWNQTPPILVPGSAGTTDYGVMPVPGGGIYILSTTSPGNETLCFRMRITLSGSMSVAMNGRVCDAVAVYLDGSPVIGPIFNGGQILLSGSFTIPSGTHTIDVSYSHFQSSPEAAQLFLFPWMPYSNGVLSSTIISAING